MNDRASTCTSSSSALNVADRLWSLVSGAARLADVRAEVERNYDDNRWWPKGIGDWRLRLVIAGWSTRVSYSMIDTYRTVVSRAQSLSFRGLTELSDDRIRDLVRPIGLHEARIRYLRSVAQFASSRNAEVTQLDTMTNDELVFTLARALHGASYKVAQCGALYIKGYHCGIMPVDSGMLTKVAPTLGLQLPNRPVAHEIMRRELEQHVEAHAECYRKLAVDACYEDLTLPMSSAPTWWVHLVLIYFKRLYCNRGRPFATVDALDRFVAGTSEFT